MSEEIVVRNCAPTLAGLKTGSLFACPYDSREGLTRFLRDLNRRLGPKGVRAVPLRISPKKALIYLYRPDRLHRDLEKAAPLLFCCGYSCTESGQCLTQLAKRLREDGEFPHEIGLFLSYPPEDVRGFLENRPCKCVGCWKVYENEAAAKKTFAVYKKCTRVYCQQLAKGTTIERLTVAG